MAALLKGDDAALTLRADATAMAPERLLVFEVRGTVQDFARAIRLVPGLELVDEEELSGDGDDTAPAAYLMVPTVEALEKIESLWRLWTSNKDLGKGWAPWRHLFGTLRKIRRWGPQDRVQDDDIYTIQAELADRTDDEMVRLEVELVYRRDDADAAAALRALETATSGDSGKILSQCRIPEIGYHAALVEYPVEVARRISARDVSSIAGIDLVMHIRPQSFATSIKVADASTGGPAAGPVPTGTPILALLDGVPLAKHALLSEFVNVDDQFDLERSTDVPGRRHGTAMASLIVHGDRNRTEPALRRRIHCVPVLSRGDKFPDNRLIVDLIYQAVVRMRSLNGSAPGVLIVNMSLGNVRKLFHERMSPWARLIDRLAHQYGILFLISAGNHEEPFPVPGFVGPIEFGDAQDDERAGKVIRALDNIKADRRLLSPSEAVNALTIGAANNDGVAVRTRSAAVVEPFPGLAMANASSALGPGFARSVKPDLLMPGSSEPVTVVSSTAPILVKPAAAARAHGLKVASPPRDGIENAEAFTGGTSGATALASRTCHLIHDALEDAYGDEFVGLPSGLRAVLLKALLVHTASWPLKTHQTLRDVLGPAGKSSQQKDNIRRFLGYGFGDPDLAVACTADRATFWAVGTLGRDQRVPIEVPIPACARAQARLHSLSATLAWFTPILPGRQSYRAVRMSLIEPPELKALRLEGSGEQPDANQVRRGTVISRRWEGSRAPIMVANQVAKFFVQRDTDQGTPVDELVPFGFAVTFAMPGELRIYDEVKARVAPLPKLRAG